MRLMQLLLVIALSVGVAALATSFSTDSKGDSKSDYLRVMDEFSVSDIRAASLKASMHGLASDRYWTPQMESVYQGDPSYETRLRSLASENFYRLLQEVSVGGTNPRQLGRDIKVNQKNFLTVKELEAVALANGKLAPALLDAVAPQNIWYRSLRESLRYMYSLCQTGGWPELERVRKELRLGSTDKIVPQLKMRMTQYGYPIANLDEIVDQSMLNAINDIQVTLRMKPDGVISPNGKTWKYLNTPCHQRVRQIQADMEKIRWLPGSFEDRYIFVNLAFSQFLLLDRIGGMPTTMNFKVINGRTKRKTPMMKDRIYYVILNPFWVVPPTIFIEDKVEDIKKLNYWEIDPWFASHNYEVWNKAFTRRIVPSSVDWWSIDENTDVDIYIRQRPHTQNALGVVKFMLTNSYSIYLHDTNDRQLFGEFNRQLSSGCVRLEEPLELAEYVLKGTEWTREVIDNTVAKPGEVMTTDTKIKIRDNVPVYLVNLTSQLNSDRILRFADDSYGQNIRIWSYLKGLM